MTEIAICSTFDVDSTAATVITEGFWAVRSLCDADNSNGEILQIRCDRAIGNIMDGDAAQGSISLNKLKAAYSWFDVDSSDVSLNLNNAIAVNTLWNCDNSGSGFAAAVINSLKSECAMDNSVAEIKLNQSIAVNQNINSDISRAKLEHLYLKNSPLPPEICKGIEIRGYKYGQLNKAKLIVGNTYTLDAIINGARLEGLQFVFTVKDYRKTDLILLQKSTIGIPGDLLAITAGKGDVMISNTTPVISGNLGAVQEMVTSIIIKPDDFEMVKSPSQLAYEFWAYDLMGSNTLLEAGVFSLMSL